ncbi:hypothetical protein HMPREF9701_04928 [Delftia acidovorans CCUG 274B]|uniref:hypothetical protein n=1 Tax=Delftia acidovorans TaxID=80866 RepID=UPI000352F3C4|nr:hypothetical protein [Delftia acidovorans]EPD36109.1 hypothetical protein HMPREF9701_04928 [Delftia acidovorans CCUG 274B]
MSKTHENAGVQLPEPDAWMDAEDKHYIGTSAGWAVSGQKANEDDVALYTAQAVRSLLAQERQICADLCREIAARWAGHQVAPSAAMQCATVIQARIKEAA